MKDASLVRWCALSLFGAVVCTLLDHLHATHGVLWYPHVAFWAQAWWVGPLFFGATIACIATVRFPSHAVAASPQRVAADLIGFCAAYAYTSFAAPEHPNVTLAVLVIVFVLRAVDARSPWLVVHALILAVAGTLFEAALSATGAFHYERPDFLGVPRWLPGIYLHAGLISGELAVWMKGQPSRSTESA